MSPAEALKIEAAEAAAFKAHDLVRSELGVAAGGLSFVEHKVVFDRWLAALEEVATLPSDLLDEASEQSLKLLSEAAVDVRAVFQRIIEFDPSKIPQRSFQEKQELINTLTRRFNDVFPTIAAVLGYANRRPPSIESYITKLATASSTANAQQEEVRAILEEVQHLRDAAKLAAQETGVAKFESVFGAEASYYKSSSFWWMLALVVLALATGAFAAYVYSRAQEVSQISREALVQLSVAKVLIFSLLLSALIWTGRMYRATRHNYVVNKHRQNALRTFETFVSGAAPEIKSAVLLQTTACIFTPQHSGYISSEAESSGMPTSAELLRSITDGSKP